jgi:hypothetical protein
MANKRLTKEELSLIGEVIHAKIESLENANTVWKAGSSVHKEVKARIRELDRLNKKITRLYNEEGA